MGVQSTAPTRDPRPAGGDSFEGQEPSASDAAVRFSASAVRAAKTVVPATPAKLNELAAAAAMRYADRALSPAVLVGWWRVFEFAVLAAVSVIALAVVAWPLQAELAWRFGLVSLAGAVAGIAGIQAAGGYELPVMRRGLRQAVPVAGGLGSAFAALALGLFVIEPLAVHAHLWLALWFGAGLAVLTGARLVFGLRLRQWRREGLMERRAVIVGGGGAAEALIRSLDRQPESDIRICGIFDDRGDRRSPPLVEGYPKLGNIHQLVEFCRKARVDMLIVTLPLSAEKRVLELLKSLWVLPLDIRLVARKPEVGARSRPGELPLVAVFDKPIADWNAFAKRVFDLGIASVALVLLVPILIATAAAIKLDSRGPVLFRQKRHGFNNQIIDVFKFRSMFHEMADPAANRVVTKGDPRVTPVGRFIRKWSIDELPQLWNVVRGELSLVGPRPHAVHARSSGNEAFLDIVEDYFGRHKVKPGITGWAQVKGYRGEIDQPEKLKKRVDFDLEYIENWSILFDAAILAMTPISLLKTENAY